MNSLHAHTNSTNYLALKLVLNAGYKDFWFWLVCKLESDLVKQNQITALEAKILPF